MRLPGEQKAPAAQDQPCGGRPTRLLRPGACVGGNWPQAIRVQRDTSQGPWSATPLPYLSLLSALHGLTSAFSTWGARPPMAKPSGLALSGLWGPSHIPDTPPPQGWPKVRGCGGHHGWFQTRGQSSVTMISPKVNGIKRKKRQRFWGDRQHPKPWLQPVVWVQQLGLGLRWGSWGGLVLPCEGSCPSLCMTWYQKSATRTQTPLAVLLLFLSPVTKSLDSKSSKAVCPVQAKTSCCQRAAPES